MTDVINDPSAETPSAFTTRNLTLMNLPPSLGREASRSPKPSTGILWADTARAGLTSGSAFHTISVTVMKPATRVSFLLLLPALLLCGAERYQKPPKAVLDVLNSQTTPTLTIHSART